MVRIKLPGGRLPFGQARAIARANRDHCGGDIHFTTRQDVQLYFVGLAATGKLIADLAGAGVSTREASGNTFRNIVACPLSGFCPMERVDAGLVAERLSRTWIRHPLVQHMPRKFKASVSGCGHDCAATAIDDLGFIAVEKDGRPGFRVVAGGGLGISPRLAVVLAAFVREQELPAVQEALARLHHRYSNRKKKAASRLKFLVKRFGAEEFVRLFEAEFARTRTLAQRPWAPLTRNRQPQEGEAPKLEGRMAAPDGRQALALRVGLGMIASDRLERLAGLAEAAGADGFRVARNQNLVITGVPAAAADELVAGLAAMGLELDAGGARQTDLVACPGTSTCPIGITNSNALAAALDADPAFAALPRIPIRISGCHNSCGQHHLGGIGLHGLAKKAGGRQLPHYQIHLGGVAGGATAIAVAGPTVPAARVLDAVKCILQAYQDTARKDEPVGDWAARLGQGHVVALVAPFAATDAAGLEFDWGESTAFRPPVSGDAECAAPVVMGEYLDDLALTAIGDLERGGAAGQSGETANQTERWLLKRLLLVAERDVPSDDGAVLRAAVEAAYADDAGLAAALGAVKPGGKATIDALRRLAETASAAIDRRGAP